MDAKKMPAKKAAAMAELKIVVGKGGAPGKSGGKTWAKGKGGKGNC